MNQIDHTWLEIADTEVTAAALIVEIEQRVRQRQAELGRVQQHFPIFGFVAELPQPPQDRPYSMTLYYHLRTINQMEAPETAVLLVDTPVSQMPVAGKIWRQIRRSAHNLVLFYVNRFIAHETEYNTHVMSILNELTRISQIQQAEINRLQQELDVVQRKQ